jgi:hypothetical protein
MELTGFSNDFVCDSSGFPGAMREFIGRQVARWPGLLLNEEAFGEAELAAWSLPDTRGEKYPDILTFCRDQDMNAFWDENGYALEPASGEGPFAIFFRVVSNPLYAQQLHGVRQTQPPDEPAGEFEGTQLLLAEYVATTLLTPADPREDPFSRDVLQDFLGAFGSDAPATAVTA